MFGWKSVSRAMMSRSVETTGAYDGGLLHAETRGFVMGTRVASNMGWRAVEAISAGDLVLTFDHGMQVVQEVRRTTLWHDAAEVPRTFWPLHVPVGALGNRVPVTLLPEQTVMIESEAALDAHGDPFAVVPAAALEGVRGITRMAPQAALEIVTLIFARDEVVYSDGAMLTHCPAAAMSLDDMISDEAPIYDILSLADATFLAECIVVEDNMAAHPDFDFVGA